MPINSYLDLEAEPERRETIFTLKERLSAAGLSDVQEVPIVGDSGFGKDLKTVWERRWAKLRSSHLWPAIWQYRRHFGKLDRSLVEFWLITARNP